MSGGEGRVSIPQGVRAAAGQAGGLGGGGTFPWEWGEGKKRRRGDHGKRMAAKSHGSPRLAGASPPGKSDASRADGRVAITDG